METQDTRKEEMLARLVALNHSRAAEEKAGHIRWLRPEYQNRGSDPRSPTQSALPGTETESSQSKIQNQQSSIINPSSPWPSKLPQQVTLIRQLLATDPTATPDKLSTRFGRKNAKRTEQIEGIIETLRGLGRCETQAAFLQSRPIHGRFRPLSNEHHQDQEPASGKLPEPDQDRALETVIHDLRRILSTNGEFDGDEIDSDLIERHFELFEGYAKKLGCLYGNLHPGMKGGAEHDILHDPVTGTILKFTKPSKAAYVVDFDLGTPRMVAAAPFGYLERLRLQNELFADNIRFVGLGGDIGERRIVTRQQIVEGRAARWEEITRLMVDELGFTKLRHNHGIGYEDSYAFVRDDAVVFDMRPANVFVTESGIIIPVDCIPVKMPPGKRSFFDK